MDFSGTVIINWLQDQVTLRFIGSGSMHRAGPNCIPIPIMISGVEKGIRRKEGVSISTNWPDTAEEQILMMWEPHLHVLIEGLYQFLQCLCQG